MPPTRLRAAENLERSSVPLETLRSPLKVRFPATMATLVDLLMVKLLKVVEAMDWEFVPKKTTVPVPGVKVPLLVQLPPTEMVEPPPSRVALV